MIEERVTAVFSCDGCGMVTETVHGVNVDPIRPKGWALGSFTHFKGIQRVDLCYECVAKTPWLKEQEEREDG